MKAIAAPSINMRWLFLFLCCCCLAFAGDTVFIYAGPGVSENSFKQTEATMNYFLKPQYHVEPILPEQIINDDWENKAALLIIPGGADLPYVRELNGLGNQRIRAYVENGGSFLGLCAGGYYAGAFVDFAKNTDLEVQGERELAFFPGIVRGPVLAPFDYRTESGARAAKLYGVVNTTVYYNGGGYFVDALAKDNVQVLAWYDLEEKNAAIIECQVGLGKAILSGVHFEYDPNLLDRKDSYLSLLIPTLICQNDKRLELVSYILKKLNL